MLKQWMVGMVVVQALAMSASAIAYEEHEQDRKKIVRLTADDQVEVSYETAEYANGSAHVGGSCRKELRAVIYVPDNSGKVVKFISTVVGKENGDIGRAYYRYFCTIPDGKEYTMQKQAELQFDLFLKELKKGRTLLLSQDGVGSNFFEVSLEKKLSQTGSRAVQTSSISVTSTLAPEKTSVSAE